MLVRNNENFCNFITTPTAPVAKNILIITAITSLIIGLLAGGFTAGFYPTHASLWTAYLSISGLSFSILSTLVLIAITYCKKATIQNHQEIPSQVTQQEGSPQAPAADTNLRGSPHSALKSRDCGVSPVQIVEADEQQASALCTLPPEILYIIFGHLDSLKTQAGISLLCKKMYLLNHTAAAWRPLVTKLFPKLQCDLSTQGPIKALTEIMQERKKLQEAFSEETLKAFGGVDNILALPVTDVFSGRELNVETFCDEFYLHASRTEIENEKTLTLWMQVFGKHPIVRGWDIHAPYILVNYRVTKQHESYSDFFYIRQCVKKKGKKNTYWDGSTIISTPHYYLAYADEELFNWYQKFFAGEVCAYGEVQKKTRFLAEANDIDTVQICIFEKTTENL
jgi:hypothetical protein